MCRESGVDLLLHCEAIETETANRKFYSVTVQGKGTRVAIEAKVFIDGTGDGDVAHMAGAAYEKSPRGTMQPPTVCFMMDNVKIGEVLDFIEKHPEQLRPREGLNARHFRNSRSFVFADLMPMLDVLLYRYNA